MRAVGSVGSAGSANSICPTSAYIFINGTCLAQGGSVVPDLSTPAGDVGLEIQEEHPDAVLWTELGDVDGVGGDVDGER